MPGQERKTEGTSSVPKATGRQGHVYWPLWLQRVQEVGGALRGGGAKDRDAVLRRVCKIISSSNWRVKYFGQNKINKDQEEEKSEGICLLDSSSCISSILHISPLPLNLCS